MLYLSFSNPGEHQDNPGSSLFIRHCPLMSRVLRALRGIPPSTTLPPPSAEMKNSSNCPRSDKKSVQGMHLNATKGKQRGAVKIQNHTLGKPTALASTFSEFLFAREHLLHHCMLRPTSETKMSEKTLLWFP